jgi:hypothetical protein
VNWRGPFTLHCACGWEKTYRNPIAAQWGGESHLPHCSFYATAQMILRGEIRRQEKMSRQDYFGDRPDIEWIKPNHVKNGQVVTIDMFEEFSFPGQPPKPGIRFKELPDMGLILNQTNYDFFADLFGQDEFQWGGEKVVIRIEQVENPRKNQQLQPGIRFTKYNPPAEAKPEKAAKAKSN